MVPRRASCSRYHSSCLSSRWALRLPAECPLEGHPALYTSSSGLSSRWVASFSLPNKLFNISHGVVNKDDDNEATPTTTTDAGRISVDLHYTAAPGLFGLGGYDHSARTPAYPLPPACDQHPRPRPFTLPSPTYPPTSRRPPAHSPSNLPEPALLQALPPACYCPPKSPPGLPATAHQPARYFPLFWQVCALAIRIRSPSAPPPPKPDLGTYHNPNTRKVATLNLTYPQP